MAFPFKLFPFSENTASSSVILVIVLCQCILHVVLYSFRSVERYKDGIFTCVVWPFTLLTAPSNSRIFKPLYYINPHVFKSNPFLWERGKVCNMRILFKDEWYICSSTANNYDVPMESSKKILKCFLARLLSWLRSHRGLLFLELCCKWHFSGYGEPWEMILCGLPLHTGEGQRCLLHSLIQMQCLPRSAGVSLSHPAIALVCVSVWAWREWVWETDPAKNKSPAQHSREDGKVAA